MLNFQNLKIRPTVITVIAILVSLTASISIISQYIFLKDLAYNSTYKLIGQINEKTKERVERFDTDSHNTISILELTHNIGHYPKSDIQPTLLKKITTTILNKPYIYAIYIGYDNDSFYEVINLDNDPKLREKFKANLDERWLIVKIFHGDKKRVRLEQFLNIDLKVTRNKFKEVEYFPTQRPWYIKASQNKEQIIKTEPYLFANLESYGVTYAKELENEKSVIALDISLKSLSKFLKEQTTIENTQLYLFDQNKNLIGSNINNSASKEKLMQQIHSLSLKENQVLELNDIDYFVSNKRIVDNNGSTSTLTILLPEEEIMSESNNKIQMSVLLTVIFIAIILPLIWLFTRIFTKPIEALELENEKIKNRKFDEVKQIDTPIDEIYDLSKSFVEMAESIEAYQEAQEELIDSIIKLIASTIDAKSKYTAGHCERVPELTLMLAEVASKSTDSVFKEFKLENEDEIRELSIAAWLHDCGKVTTPIYVVDKATKLETIYNRIHEIRTRFEVIHRDLTIEAFEKIAAGEDNEIVLKELKQKHLALHEDYKFIAETNMGNEFMKEEDKQRVRDIGKQKWRPYFDESLGLSYEEEKRYTKSEDDYVYLLEDKASHIIPRENINNEYEDLDIKMDVPENLYNLGEIYNLTIDRGTLTNEERFKINEHIIMTIKMLEQLPLPEYLKRVPEYAGAHHETLIGTGYPRKLTKEDMSIPARIMAVADVFEALTASDRPYKKAKTLSEAIKIMSFMVKDKHLDEDIFKLFLENKVYLNYANKFLESEQIDEIKLEEYV